MTITPPDTTDTGGTDDRSDAWDELEAERRRATANPPPKSRGPLVARVLGAIGRVFISVGVIILLFVAYQLWGTGLREARSQQALSNEFESAITERIEAVEAETADQQTPSTPTTADLVRVPSADTLARLGPPPPPTDGDAIAQIRIPKIGVDKIVVEGVGVEDLKKGPGHYGGTALPGQPGNAAIAGHRTTYGAPFNRIDELDRGDTIHVTTLQGGFSYTVSETRIVAPHQVEVLQDFGDNRLTLTSCHPKFSARERIIVTAILNEDPAAIDPVNIDVPGEDTSGADDPPSAGDAPSTPETDEPIATSSEHGIDGDPAATTPALVWGVAAGTIWLLAWIAAKRWRAIPAYALGLPFFAVTLFFFFENFARLLPSGY